jgi:hypothetical protein
MSDELKDTARLNRSEPLGKSVEEVEGEPQLRHPDDRGMLGRILHPDDRSSRDATESPSVLTSLEHSLGMDNDEAVRSPDADRGSSEES